MTTETTSDWLSYANKARYQQQRVNQPPNEQNANNARFAVWHFSHKQTLLKFESPPRWGDDGRGRRGAATEYDFWCEVQPARGNDEAVLEQLRQGQRVRGMVVVHYDPFYPADTDEPHVPLYPNGLYVRTADQRHKLGVDLEIDHAFSDVLIYDGLKWLAVESDFMHGGGDEDLQGNNGVIGRAIFALWEDYQHERHSSTENDELFTGADIP